MKVSYQKAMMQLCLFSKMKISLLPYFQRRRNFRSKSYALWAIDEIAEMAKHESLKSKDHTIDLVQISEDFISKMNHFLDIRYFDGFACAGGTASRLKKFLLMEYGG